jgi:hypothetical protein
MGKNGTDFSSAVYGTTAAPVCGEDTSHTPELSG